MPKITVGVILLLFLSASPLLAFSGNDLRVASIESYTAEMRTSVFGCSDGPTDLVAVKLETLRLAGRRVGNRPPVSASETIFKRMSAAPARTGNRKRIGLAILFSALLPGAGELYLYKESRQNSILARVPFFFALEGYLWYGYDHNHSKGKDFKRQYEEFADAHWDLDRFLLQHPCCSPPFGCESYQEYNETCTGELYFLFIPKDEDREEYYENIGKYDAFVFGWDDWNSQPDYWTPNRREYWALRTESDKYLLRGDQHLMGLIINRVVSMIDAGWLAYRMGKDQPQQGGWSIELEPGLTVAGVSLSYRF